MIGEILQSPLLSVLVMVAISGVYFYAGRASSMVLRILFSIHGLLGASYLVVAMVIWRSGLSSPEYEMVYTYLFLLPLASIIISFVYFTGKKMIHLLQIVNLLGLIWCWFIGIMAITDNWL